MAVTEKHLRTAGLLAPRQLVRLCQLARIASTAAVVGVGPAGPTSVLEFQPVEPLSVDW